MTTVIREGDILGCHICHIVWSRIRSLVCPRCGKVGTKRELAVD